MEKCQLRKETLALRGSLSEEQRTEISDRIAEYVLQSDWYQTAKTILCYAASGSEISVNRIADAAWKDQKTVCFPRCLDAAGQMRFYVVGSFADLQTGMYGILEPAESCPPMIHFSTDSLCLMPGLAFDANGYRLGYGKGYYDRFLPAFSGRKIGICPECCYREEQRWEYDRYDIAADWVVTERGILRIQ